MVSTDSQLLYPLALGRFSRIAWLGVLASVTSAFVGTSYLVLPGRPTVNTYIIQPFLWIAPAIIAILIMGKSGIRPEINRMATAGAAINAFAFVMVGFVASLYLGLGWSPYSHTLTSIALNLWYVFAILVSREIARWYLLRSLQAYGEGVAIGVVWIVFAVTSVPLEMYSGLSHARTAFELTGTEILPALGVGFLATCLTSRGSYVASITYLGIILATEWLSPVLPNLPMLASAVIGIVVPMTGALLMFGRGERSSSMTDTADEELIGPSKGVLIAAALVVAFVWFNTGITGLKPTIVNGISMQPTYYTGDVVVTRSIDPDDLRVGDIIVFTHGPLSVVHRIIEVRNENTGLTFVTQGDNNDAADEPVEADDVVGRVELHVPKAGLPAVWTKQAMTAIIR